MEEGVEFLKSIVLIGVVVVQSWALADMTIDALVQNEHEPDRHSVESHNGPYHSLIACRNYGEIDLLAKSENSGPLDHSGH